MCYIIWSNKCHNILYVVFMILLLSNNLQACETWIHCHMFLKTCLISVQYLQSTMIVDLNCFFTKAWQLPTIHMLAFNIKPPRFLWCNNYLEYIWPIHMTWDYRTLWGYDGITQLPLLWLMFTEHYLVAWLCSILYLLSNMGLHYLTFMGRNWNWYE